jgi:hypothetical protein
MRRTAWPSFVFVHAVTAVACLWAFGCRDAAAPPPLGVRIDIDSTHVGVFYGEHGVPFVGCTFALKATANGIGRARWTGAQAELFQGVDRTQTAETFTLDSASTAAAWAADTLATAQVEHSLWYARGPLPFEMTVTFGFAPVGGQPAEASTRVRCGDIPPSNPIGPSLDHLELQPHNDSWQPGQTIHGQYHVSSSQPLWLSDLLVTGGVSSEALTAQYPQRSIDATFDVPIPSDAVLGDPVVVTVYAVNEFGQEVEQSIATNPVADKQAPILRIRPWDPYQRECGAVSATVPGGTFFTGQELSFCLSASDNGQLAHLVWEVSPAGTRDSMPVTRLVRGNLYSTAVILPNWVGTQAVRLFVRDQAGNTSDTLASGPGAFTIYPTLTRPTVSTGVTYVQPNDIVVDEKRALLYVLFGNTPYLKVFALSDLHLVRQVTLPHEAAGMDITPSGDTLVVALPLINALATVQLDDPDSSAVILPLPDSVTSRQPVRVRVMHNGHVFVMMQLNWSGHDFRLLEYDLASGARRWVTELPDSGSVDVLVRSANHERMFIHGGSCFDLYDADVDAFGPCVQLSSRGTMSSNALGDRFAIGSDVYDASLHLLSQAAPADFVEQDTHTSTLSPDGATLVRWAALSLVRSRAADGTILDRTVLPECCVKQLVWAVSDTTLFVSQPSEYVLRRFDMRGQFASIAATRPHAAVSVSSADSSTRVHARFFGPRLRSKAVFGALPHPRH